MATTHDEIKRAYNEEGFVCVPDILSTEELRSLRRAVDGMSEQARALTESNDVFDLEAGHSSANPRLRRVKAPHKVHPAFAEFMSNQRLLEVLALLLGENIRHQYVKLNIKAADGGSPLEWHQDWAFYPHTNSSVLAVGLMLDDVTPENGPTLVIPGSHRPRRVFDHHRDGFFSGAIDPSNSDLDFNAAVPLLGRAGSITIHDAFLVHGAARNLSSNVRRICFYEFMAADAWPLEGVTPPDVHAALGGMDERIVQGSPTLTPRLESLPVRLPLPRPQTSYGSIYTAQEHLPRKYFG